jgi:uncharacterized membrane protein YoaK (UPF0700 family)
MKKVMVIAIAFYNNFVANKATIVVTFFGGIATKKVTTYYHRHLSCFLTLFGGFATKKRTTSSQRVLSFFSCLLSFFYFSSSMVLLLQRRLVHYN